MDKEEAEDAVKMFRMLVENEDLGFRLQYISRDYDCKLDVFPHNSSGKHGEPFSNPELSITGQPWRISEVIRAWLGDVDEEETSEKEGEESGEGEEGSCIVEGLP